MAESGISWIERAKRLLEYRKEATEFVERVQEQFPVGLDDVTAVSMLWFEADMLDDMVCSLLSEMNAGLLEESGEMDITRGASTRSIGMGLEADEQVVHYECTWSLVWGDERGVAVNLAIDPRTRTFEAFVIAQTAGESQRVRYPFGEDDLKDPLALAYVAEAAAEIRG